MKYYVYPSTEYIGDSVLLEVTRNKREPDNHMFTDFECDDDCVIVPHLARLNLIAAGYETSNTVVAVVD